MPNTIDIIIADDHPLFRAGVRQTLDADARYRVVGEAGDGGEALALIREHTPEIAVLDIQMPGINGLQAITKMHQEQLPTKALLLTMYRNRNYFYQAVLHGAKGYVLKETAQEELIQAVGDVCAGGTFVSASLEPLLRGDGRAMQDDAVIIEGLKALTATEKQVLKKVAEWKTNGEIGEELSISPRTVGSHRNHISEKLNLRGAHSLISFAIENRELF